MDDLHLALNTSGATTSAEIQRRGSSLENNGSTWGPCATAQVDRFVTACERSSSPIRNGRRVRRGHPPGHRGRTTMDEWPSVRGLAGREPNGLQARGDRVVEVARRRLQVVAVRDQGEQDTHRDPDRQPAGVTASVDVSGRRHRGGHVLRLPQQRRPARPLLTDYLAVLSPEPAVGCPNSGDWSDEVRLTISPFDMRQDRRRAGSSPATTKGLANRGTTSTAFFAAARDGIRPAFSSGAPAEQSSVSGAAHAAPLRRR